MSMLIFTLLTLYIENEQVIETRHEESGMHGASERKSETYTEIR